MDNHFAVAHFFHIIYLMSFLNKLVSWPVFTLLLLILLTVPNIGLTATASLSHDGGSIWKVGGPNIKFNWNSGAARVERVYFELFESRNGSVPSSNFSPSLNYHLLDSNGSGISNPPPGVPATKSGSFSWTVRQMPVLPENTILSRPFYIRLLTFPNRSSNTPDTKSSWMGPYQTLSADACSLTTQVTGNGTITPATNTVWSNGQTKTVTFTPNAGHRIATAVFPQPYGVRPSACIETNGGACIPVATSGTGTLTKTLSCTTGAQYKAKVTFEAIPSCPVPSQIVGTGGKVTLVPAAPVTTVAGGQNLKVTAISNAGYKIKEFKLRSYDSWFTMSDATGKATSTQTLSCPAGQTKKLGYDVAFERLGFSVTSSVNGNVGGTITPLGKKDVTQDIQSYTIIANTGYFIEWIKVDGVESFKTAVGRTSTSASVGRKDNMSARTIEVKFKLNCSGVTPEQTISDIKNGKATYINRSSFRTWVRENETLVKNAITSFQCTPDSFAFDETLGMWSPNEIDHILIALNNAIPGHAFLFITGKVWYTNSNGQTYTDNVYHYIVHSFIVTGILKSVNGRYAVGYLDSNGPTLGTMTCLEQPESENGIPTGTLILKCPLYGPYVNSSSFAMNGGIFKPEYLSIEANAKYIGAKNIQISKLPLVRLNAISWLKDNYTPIDNFSPPESTGGVCSGWSDFNIRSSILVKECPVSNKTSLNTKEEISFLNQLAVKETITDKYLAQLALLWQIDDVVRGWWGRVMK